MMPGVCVWKQIYKSHHTDTVSVHEIYMGIHHINIAGCRGFGFFYAENFNIIYWKRAATTLKRRVHYVLKHHQ